MFASECRVMTKVLNISYKLFPLLISLRSLRILKERKIVITPRISSEVFAEMKMLIKEPRIMIVSKMFQPSLKYTLGSIAISFTIASKVNVAVKK